MNMKRKCCCGAGGGCQACGNCCYSPASRLQGWYELYHYYNLGYGCDTVTNVVNIRLSFDLVQAAPGVWQAGTVTIVTATDNGLDISADLDLVGNAGQGGANGHFTVTRNCTTNQWEVDLLIRRGNCDYKLSYIWIYGGTNVGGAQPPTAPWVSGGHTSPVVLDGECCGVAGDLGTWFPCFPNGTLLYSVYGFESASFAVAGNKCCHDPDGGGCKELTDDTCPDVAADGQCTICACNTETMVCAAETLGTSGADCNCGTELNGVPHDMTFSETATMCQWGADWPGDPGGGFFFVAQHDKTTGLDRVTFHASSGPTCAADYDSGWVEGLLTCVGGRLTFSDTYSFINHWPLDESWRCNILLTIG